MSIYGKTDTVRNVINVLDDLDIKNKLAIYSLLLAEFPGTKSVCLKKTLISVKNTIIDIEIELDSINKKIRYNQSLLVMSKIRSYSIDTELTKIQSLVDKLDKRIISLKTITEISKLWNNEIFDPNEKLSIKDDDDAADFYVIEYDEL